MAVQCFEKPAMRAPILWIGAIRAVMEPMAVAIEEGRRRGPAHPPAHSDTSEQGEKADKKKKERTSKGKEAALTA